MLKCARAYNVCRRARCAFFFMSAHARSSPFCLFAAARTFRSALHIFHAIFPRLCVHPLLVYFLLTQTAGNDGMFGIVSFLLFELRAASW